MTMRQNSSFGLSADFIKEYKAQTVNEVQILGANGLKIMVSFQRLLVSRCGPCLPLCGNLVIERSKYTSVKGHKILFCIF